MTESRRRLRLPRGPEEGWLTLGLVALMTLCVAWSIDDAAWVLGRGEWTDFLTWAALGGVAIGAIGAKAGWGRLTAHAIGAAFAALLVPLVVGGIVVPDAPPGVAYEATAAAAWRAFSDLILDGLSATRQTGHHLLVLGCLVWATGQFAASAVFRHHRPLGAVIVVGAVLIGNMSATVRPQIWFIVFFTLASLFLLIRQHAREEQTTWVRRRIGDPGAVGALYLRGGTIFILIAVLSAFTLTTSARSAPLAGAWEGVKPLVLEVSAAIQRFLPNGEGRTIGSVLFGPSVTVRGLWSTEDGEALEIQVPVGDREPYYWRVMTYDAFRANGTGWDASIGASISRAAGTPLLADTLEAPVPDGRREVTFLVTPLDQVGSWGFSPDVPQLVDREARVDLTEENGHFTGFQVNGRSQYRVTALVRVEGDETAGAITANKLKAAGQVYPQDIIDRYLGFDPSVIGEDAQKLLDDVKAAAGSNPYDLTVALRNELQSRDFTYVEDVRRNDCGNRSELVECFVHFREGYCQHYSSTMAILLRAAGIPTRWVQGYLPGVRDRVTGIEIVGNDRAHAWVEVYFPTYGWVMFDPTGGDRSVAEDPIEGSPVPSASPSARPSLVVPSGRDQEGPSRRPGTLPPGTSPPNTPGLGGPLVIVTLVVLGAVGLIAAFAWRRGPRGPTTPDGAFGGVARLAARFGFGPRPTQTAYEYAAALGDVLPNVRPELHTVATAKVEVAYGRRALGDDQLRAVRDAYRRLRVSLLRLAFRRKDRPRRR